MASACHCLRFCLRYDHSCILAGGERTVANERKAGISTVEAPPFAKHGRICTRGQRVSANTETAQVK